MKKYQIKAILRAIEAAQDITDCMRTESDSAWIGNVGKNDKFFDMSTTMTGWILDLYGMLDLPEEGETDEACTVEALLREMETLETGLGEQGAAVVTDANITEVAQALQISKGEDENV